MFIFSGTAAPIPPPAQMYNTLANMGGGQMPQMQMQAPQCPLGGSCTDWFNNCCPLDHGNAGGGGGQQAGGMGGMVGGMVGGMGEMVGMMGGGMTVAPTAGMQGAPAPPHIVGKITQFPCKNDSFELLPTQCCCFHIFL